jgi:hypothetical protein
VTQPKNGGNCFEQIRKWVIVVSKTVQEGIRSFFRTLEVKKRLPIKLPKRASTKVDLSKHANILNIRNFRGVFMKDSLSKLNVRANECGIINSFANVDGSNNKFYFTLADPAMLCYC